MRVKTLTTAYMGSHCYLLIEDGHAVLIDPGDAELAFQAIHEEAVTVDFGILTHEHCDHIYGSEQIRNKLHCRLVASRACGENIKSSRKNFSQYFNAFIGVQTKIPAEQQKCIEPFEAFADEVFDGEILLKWMDHNLLLRETPGHSQGSICVQVDDSILFSGDTLMKDDLTDTKFLGGNQKLLREVTMPWLRNLPPELIVYAGHGDCFYLGDRLREPII